MTNDNGLGGLQYLVGFGIIVLAVIIVIVIVTNLRKGRE